MVNYLDTYNQMLQASAPVEKTAEQVQEDERIAVFQEYEKLATSALANDHGEGNFSAEDVVKVASAMINNDLEQYDAMQKVAEWTQQGQIIGHACGIAAAETFLEVINSKN